MSETAGIVDDVDTDQEDVGGGALQVVSTVGNAFADDIGGLTEDATPFKELQAEEVTAGFLEGLESGGIVGGIVGAIAGFVEGISGDLEKPDSVRDHLTKMFRDGVAPFVAAAVMIQTNGDPDQLQAWRDSVGIGSRDARNPQIEAILKSCGEKRCFEGCAQIHVWWAIVWGLIGQVELGRETVDNPQNCAGTGSITLRLPETWYEDLFEVIAPGLAIRDASVWPLLVEYALASRGPAGTEAINVNLGGIRELLVSGGLSEEELEEAGDVVIAQPKPQAQPQDQASATPADDPVVGQLVLIGITALAGVLLTLALKA